MDSRRAGGIVLFGIAVLVIIWVLLSLMPKVASAPQTAGSTTGTTAALPAQKPVELLVHHSAKGSMHTYEGSIDLPTPCTEISASTSVSYAATSTVTLALVTSAPQGACAEVVTPQKFTTSVTSKVTPIFLMTVNGVPANVQVLEK